MVYRGEKRISDGYKGGAYSFFKPVAATVIAIVLFAVVLWTAVASLGAADEDIKRAPEAPDSLMSAGAPRSQLELSRMFGSMSLSYTENGKTVYEPISAEYRIATEKKLADGDRPMLSVEEILFIIADTPTVYERYEIIRLRGADGTVEREIVTGDICEGEKAPFHRASLERIALISEMIEYRIAALSAKDAFKYDDEGVKYYEPREDTRGGGSGDTPRGCFMFCLHGRPTDFENAVVYRSESGKDISLYPSEKTAGLCRTKVILQNEIKATEAERDRLAAAGYTPERCKNVTPKYWYSETEARIFVFGSRVILVDPSSEGGVTLLPDESRLMSVAIGYVSDEDVPDVYISVAYEGGSAVLRYSSGKLETILSSESEILAVCEPIEAGYDSIQVYEAVRFEDARFVIALECRGEPVEKYLMD